MRRGPFLVFFAVSGAAALIYEVVWTRLLTLQMGHGVAAASTVLAAFMGGLAIGSAIAGRIGGRLSPQRALSIYASLELTIAVLALLLPLGLAALRPMLSSAYAEGNGGTTFAMLRLATSVLLLAAPAAAMGATFPIASRWMVRVASHAARDAGGLYAANTLGAAIGAVLAGFVLIPTLGLSGSTWVAVVLNVIAAAGAFAIARTAIADESEKLPTEAARVKGGTGKGGTEVPPLRVKGGTEVPPLRTDPWVAALALGASGFASLTLQVVWTRLLVLILGPTTYAFSIVVSIFIVGLAGGAAIGARLAARSWQPARGLALCLLASAGFAIAAAWAVDATLLILAEIVARPGIEFNEVMLREVMIVSALLLPMTLAFGAAFPFAVSLASQSNTDDTVTENIGRIYAVNTIGAVTGALLTGFILIPRIGLRATIGMVATLVAIAAILLLLAAAQQGRSRVAALIAALLVLMASNRLPQWDRLLLSSGAYKYAIAMRGPSLETALTAGELLSYREGSTGTVAVRRLAGTMSLAIDGKVDASNAGDMLTQRLLAHLPLLLHPDPKRAAVLGLGSGVTLGSALTHPLSDATVLEISPEVVDASRFFETENHRALANPRTRLVVGDGRTHLMLGRASYDVIISEPSNPWMAGIASLFTKEFFEGARARLAPGGVLCQWAHTYDISNDDLKSIVATFLSVFPHGTMWLVGDADVLLIGSTEPLGDRISGITESWQRPGVADDLASVGIQNPFSVTSLFVAQGPTLAAWAAGVALQTDDRSRLEFSGPRSIFGASRDDNAASVRALAAASPKPAAVQSAINAATPVEWRDRGLMFLRADAHRPAYEDLARALESSPNDPAALDGLVRAAAALERLGDARALLTRLASDPAHPGAKLALSRLLASQGATDEAVRIPFSILQTEPGNVAALEQLASVLSDAGDAERLEPVVARLVREAPSNPWGHYYAASLFFLKDRPDQALQAARNAVSLDPNHAKALNLIGASLASMGQHDQARQAFTASIAADPREPGTYTNLATLELQTGNPDRARRYFAEALTIDPTNEAARQGLAALR
ncbi:MAG: fused MFS/spermidine synthase [Acidobacteriota bacterium]|nr:fused MFS/spermidine synthase [Acidobacteriota bacterium]